MAPRVRRALFDQRRPRSIQQFLFPESNSLHGFRGPAPRPGRHPAWLAARAGRFVAPRAPRPLPPAAALRYGRAGLTGMFRPRPCTRVAPASTGWPRPAPAPSNRHTYAHSHTQRHRETHFRVSGGDGGAIGRGNAEGDVDVMACRRCSRVRPMSAIASPLSFFLTLLYAIHSAIFFNFFAVHGSTVCETPFAGGGYYCPCALAGPPLAGISLLEGAWGRAVPAAGRKV